MLQVLSKSEYGSYLIQNNCNQYRRFHGFEATIFRYISDGYANSYVKMNSRTPMKRRTWLVADTVRTDRKDIFCFVEGNQHHVGTIISGSRRYLERFETEVSLIRRSPEMKSILQSLVDEGRSNKVCPNRIRQLAQIASMILDEIGAPYEEG